MVEASPSGTPKSTSRLQPFMAIVAGMLVYCTGTAVGLVFPKAHPIVMPVATVLCVAAFVWFVISVWKRFKKRLFFKVRNRVILFYLFSGLLPIVLVILLAALVMMLFFSNLSIFIYQNELKSLSYRLHSLNSAMVEVLYHQPELTDDPEALLEQFQTVILTRASDMPDITTMLYTVDAQRAISYRLIASPLDWQTFQGEFLPDWLEQLTFSGLMIKNFSLYIYSHNPVTIGGKQYYLDLFIPFRKPLFNYLVANSNLRSFVTISETITGGGTEEDLVTYYPFSGFKGDHPQLLPAEALEREKRFQEAKSAWDFTIQALNTIEATDWFTHEASPATQKQIWVHLQLPVTTIIQILATQSPTNRLFFQILLFVLYSFLAIQVMSIIVGMFIIRSTPRSIHELSKGTEELKKGNLNYKIPVGNRDELGELSRSFNTMTFSIQELLKEVADKQRIKRELEIAREVQQKFFPKTTPQLRGLFLSGRCQPAREVSGDFFDFLQSSPHVIDIVIGDISGKGISAALLMASLQSAIRAQPPLLEGESQLSGRLAQLMNVLNRHLYQLTPPEKFATLCYLRLSTADKSLRYCNAGHESPFLIRADGSAARLQTGGTVLGAFPEMQYEIGEIDLRDGDLLTVYTDGLVDAIGPDGVEFGEDRWLQSLQELRDQPPDDVLERTISQVNQWSRGAPQHDDITVVVARIGQETRFPAPAGS